MQIDAVSAGKDEVFTALRPSLYSVAYHMLANAADAEDMVQESYLRWGQTDQSQVRVPKAFLTTVVTRLCLKHLQSAHVQREQPLGSEATDVLQAAQADAPDTHSQLADSLSEAVLLVLKVLSPLERAVFLLREVFDCEFSEIAATVGKSEENCRQILRRARERIDTRKPRYEVTPRHEDQIVKRFLQAAADGNWAELIDVLSDDATLVCDGSDLTQGAISVQGPHSIAELVFQRAPRWLGKDVSIKLLRFQASPAVFACRNGSPVSSIFLSTRDGKVQSLRIITCPVRVRSFLVLN